MEVCASSLGVNPELKPKKPVRMEHQLSKLVMVYERVLLMLLIKKYLNIYLKKNPKKNNHRVHELKTIKPKDH